MLVKEKTVTTTSYVLDKAEFEGFLFGPNAFELPAGSTWQLQTNGITFTVVVTTTTTDEYEA